MTENKLKEKTAKGLLWGGMSNGMMQVLNALFGICLLNLLTPADYGMVQVLNVFSSIAGCLQESGFIATLANKKNPTHEDYNAVFWFNTLCGLIMYIILFFAAPLIADFYKEPELIPLSRFVFLSFFISSFGIAQRAYLFGHLMVKESSIISVCSLLISGISGVAMAYAGFAFWGLAIQSVIFVTVIVLMNWYYSPWRPTFTWNFRPIREMFGFSYKLLITSLFNQINRNVLSTLLGHYYSKHITGQYGNASKWNEMSSSTINGMISGVAQPVLAQVKDDIPRYIHIFRKMIRFTSFIAFPAMLGLGFIAHEFIYLTVGEAWLESADLLRILCIYGAFIPIYTLYYNLVVTQGKSNINMLNTILSCVTIWAAMIALHSFGIRIMVITFISINIGWLLIWHYFAWKLVRLSLWDIMKDICPFILIALAAILLSWMTTRSITHPLWLMLAKIATTAVYYPAILWIFRAQVLRESLEYLLKKKKN